jgi:hypothetical protein
MYVCMYVCMYVVELTALLNGKKQRKLERRSFIHHHYYRGPLFCLTSIVCCYLLLVCRAYGRAVIVGCVNTINEPTVAASGIDPVFHITVSH